MSLVNPLEYIKKAKKENKAIPAFNIHNLVMLQAITETAAELKSPVIIQTSQGTIKHMGLQFIVNNVKTASEVYGTPITLHLDHCTDYNTVIKCIRAGYTSVMVDGSMLSYNKNVAFTREVVKVAKAVDVVVEGEIGKISGTEDKITINEEQANLTDPQEAKKFAQDTSLDLLAVAIGTAHGQYKGEPKLDFKRLEEIAKIVDVPLVLHGGSGIPEKSTLKAIKKGMSKINISTDLKMALTGAIKDYFTEQPDSNDPRKYFGKGRDVLKEVIKEKIKLCGSDGLLDDMGV